MLVKFCLLSLVDHKVTFHVIYLLALRINIFRYHTAYFNVGNLY